MPWTPPLTRKGEPCRKCRPGRLCRPHRAPSKVRTGNGGPRPKLTRSVLDLIEQAAPTAPGHEALWTAAGVGHSTWFRWLDAGEADAQEGKVTPERELWESVKNHRRNLAHRLTGAAVNAALGARVQGKDGAYDLPPDGRLAAQLASRLDPSALPPERTEVEHAGEVRTPIVLEFDPSKFPKPKETKP